MSCLGSYKKLLLATTQKQVCVRRAATGVQVAVQSSGWSHHIHDTLWLYQSIVGGTGL